MSVPDYDWWSEALHGVANTGGVTVFPEPIGLGATFDPEAINRMAIAISTEARIKYVHGMRDGHSDIFQGLDFWAPNINIFRDPVGVAGRKPRRRPIPDARLGVAFVTGLQGDDPKYYRAIATPKHCRPQRAETRAKADVVVSKHDQLDTYCRRSARP